MLATLLADKGRRNFIRDSWDRLCRFPGGTRVFSRAVGMAAPYTATIDAHVVALGPGHSEVTMRDRRAVRNHIDCVHAVALANLVELTGNVAVAYSLPDDGRFIVSKMSLEYLAKARGPLRAVGTCPATLTSERRELEVTVSIFNAEGTEVTRGSMTTLVGPKKTRA
jgi:acyl-coenzyme A thioesterase PaaI-like protein